MALADDAKGRRPRRSGLALTAMLGAIGLLLAACSAGASGHMAADGTMNGDMTIDGSVLGDHVHNLAFDGNRLLLGTHQGLFAQSGEDEPVRISDEPFDVMGFAMAGSTWMASGHPGVGMEAPADLGFMTSSDMGKTWATISLGGQVDFHRLVALGKAVLGINSGNSHLMRSEDGGATWTDFGKTTLYDIAMAPADASTVIGSSEQGLMRSTDGGKTFSTVAGAPLLALLSVTGSKLLGADVYGVIFESIDAGITWSEVGALASQPSALAASGKDVVALVDTTIYWSTDGGRTFAKHLDGVGAH